MLNENEFQEIQNKIIDAFDKSIDVDDTIYFDEQTTLYEQIMFILSDYAVNANSIYVMLDSKAIEKKYTEKIK